MKKQDKRKAPADAFRTQGTVRDHEARIVAPDRPGPHQDGIEFSPQAHDLGPVFGARYAQARRRTVVQRAVGRNGHGCENFHRTSVITVISGQAPSRMG